MFIGYQNDKIAFVAETREELENLPCVILDKIEENSEEYVLQDGVYILKTEAEILQSEENKQARIAELKQMLSDTDYILIKLAEDAASREEYAEELAQRAEWRKEINELEEA